MTGNQLVTYLKKSFFTGTFKTIIVTLSTIIFLPLIISKIGMANYGLISLTLIFGGMVVFADFGISKSVTLLIGKLKDKSNSSKIVTSALVINGIIMFIIGLILSFLVYLNIPLLGTQLDISISLRNYIVLIGFISLIIFLLNNLLTAILEAFYLMHYVNIGFTISSVLVNLCIYLMSILTDSIYLLILSPVLAYLSVTMFFLFIVIKHTPVYLEKINILEKKYYLFHINFSILVL